MKREVLQRIEALEAAKDGAPEIWVAPTERGLAGWECMGQNSVDSKKVHRLPGESDEDLANRARECMKDLHRADPSTAKAAVYFAFDDIGMTR
ncbi:hypothetical protein [Halomonas sp. Mc5H-6]|uniref:hypothetical protein n=1 Tax=Halomonas sp. Mc5H-6 TaxID=2954500 RepID=UPI0020982D49|nr:hypothetical protein [Halomonas sp. Mc5H-6]MCO7245260.1 hypothetical protein [Halomonas sp. Mc5H-6]